VKLDDAVADWIDDAVAWWLHELGPIGSVLAMPIAEQFPDPRPEALFDAVVEIADLRDWRFELVDESEAAVEDPLRNVPRPAQPRAVLVPDPGERSAIPEHGPYPIPYSREEARDPAHLIAGFARGISHYYLYSAADEPPDTEDHHEAYVEIGAVLLGFGVFLANTTFQFQQYDSGGLHGWSWSSRGELGEDALGYALALFVELTASDPKLALAHLAANPKAAFRWARGQLAGARRDTLDHLRAITPPAHDGGPYR
jgi:hypothetical protein